MVLSQETVFNKWNSWGDKSRKENCVWDDTADSQHHVIWKSEDLS